MTRQLAAIAARPQRLVLDLRPVKSLVGLMTGSIRHRLVAIVDCCTTGTTQIPDIEPSRISCTLDEGIPMKDLLSLPTISLPRRRRELCQGDGIGVGWYDHEAEHHRPTRSGVLGTTTIITVIRANTIAISRTSATRRWREAVQ